MSEVTSTDRLQNERTDDVEISLLDVFIVLAKYKVAILVLPFLAAVVSAGLALNMPDIYTGVTRILAPQQTQSATALLGQQLGNLAGLPGIRNPADLYVGMLRSRTVADSIRQRFKLDQIYASNLQSSTRARLEGATRIAAGKDGIITIEVDDKDPKRAAELANAYVDELFNLTKLLAVTDASQKRLFYERQLEQTRDNLTKAEIAGRASIAKGGLIEVEGQGRAIVENSARLRGQITVKEVQIGTMNAFATERNPELQRARQELEAMKRELAKMEGTSLAKPLAIQHGDNDRAFDSVRLLRNVKYYETIYELLSKQYELAKIDEAKDSAIVQVIDKAIEPDRKSKPARLLIVVSATFAMFLVVLLLALVRETFERVKSNPRQAERLDRLKAQLRFGKR